MPFEDYLPKTMPPWLRGRWGTAFNQAAGRRMDDMTERFRQSAFASLPAFAPGDALNLLGEERQLPRGPGESDADYAVRLDDAWDAWEGDNTPIIGKGGGAASHLGILTELKVAGLPTGPTGATIVQQNGRYSQLDVTGALVLGTLSSCINRIDLTGAVNPRPGWTFEPRDNFYSEWGLLFPAPATFDPAVVNAVVARWRPSKALFIGTWVITSGKTFGWPVGQTWGDGVSVWGGNTGAFYPGPTSDDQTIGYAP